MSKRILLAGAGALTLALAWPLPSAAQDTQAQPAQPEYPTASEDYMVTSRSLISDIQQALSDLGYEPGPIDGIVGPRTRAAIRAYQQDAGLPVNGKADEALMASLDSRGVGTGGREDPALAEQFETALDRLGYAVGDMDGVLDHQLQLAIAAYARSARLPVQGRATEGALLLIQRQQHRNDSEWASKLIWNVETELAGRGYRTGPIDGTNDPFTTGAIIDYSDDSGLGLNGKVNAALLDSLGLTDPRSVTPADIREIEYRLERRGYGAGTVDGVADAQTESAIKAYQADSGLIASGAPSVILLEDLRRTIRTREAEAPPEA
jgi:peptidoglycan hydrolase-like protein with peptidoglycan-binding domain